MSLAKLRNRSRTIYLLKARTAALRSTDSRCKVGAVIHCSNGFIDAAATGVNHQPVEEGPGYPWPDKNDYTLHAEIDVLLKMGRLSLHSSMFITKAPCLSCALAIKRAGVSEVIIDSEGSIENTRIESKWLKTQEAAREYLLDAGISYVVHDVGC